MQTLTSRYLAYRARKFAPMTAIQAARSDAERGRQTPTLPTRKPRPKSHGDVFRMRDVLGDKRTFVMAIAHDDDDTPPWERAEGHGPVSDWTTRDKRPGEVELSSGHGRKRFYDWQEATAIAKRDGWGLSPAHLLTLAALKGRKPTRKEIAAEAVRRDFEFLRSWCNDQWHYVGVVVFELPHDKELNPESVADDLPFKYLPHASIWGIESNADSYLAETAEELIGELL